MASMASMASMATVAISSMARSFPKAGRRLQSLSLSLPICGQGIVLIQDPAQQWQGRVKVSEPNNDFDLGLLLFRDLISI